MISRFVNKAYAPLFHSPPRRGRYRGGSLRMVMLKCRTVPGIVIAFFTLASPSAAAAPTSLRVAYPAPTASFLPLWTAHDAGFFKKNNLSVELIQVGSSTRGMAAMLG